MSGIRQIGGTEKISFIGRMFPAGLCGVALLLGINLVALPMVSAGEAEDLAEMQKKLNAEVMDKPFSVEDSAKIDAYIKDAMKKDLKPRERPPARWKRGGTCADLHVYNEYRDCLYYYRYHGRYWQ